MKLLLENIKTRLSSITAIRYIDENWGQLNYPDPPLKYPSAIIDIEDVMWKNQGKHLQDGIATLSIQIADIKLGNSSRQAPESQKTRAAHIFDVMSQVHAALHGWSHHQSHGPLTRIQTRKINRNDGIRHFEMIYSCQVIDDSAKQKTIMYPMTQEKIDLETNVIQ